MTEAGFYLEIITPIQVLLDGNVSSVVLAGSRGEMGILPNHAPLLALLQSGVTRVKAQGREVLFVTGPGFVQVNANHVSVLVEFAEKSDDVDVEACRKRLDEIGRSSLAELRKATLARIQVAEALHS
jgi:F-type H+-transporting ATPase subunit epsilon